MNYSRENAPLCLRFTVYEGRGALLRDSTLCASTHSGKRFYINQAEDVNLTISGTPDPTHPDFALPYGHCTAEFQTDNPAEAETIYARSCEWVRTGEEKVT